MERRDQPWISISLIFIGLIFAFVYSTPLEYFSLALCGPKVVNLSDKRYRNELVTISWAMIAFKLLMKEIIENNFYKKFKIVVD